MKEVKLKSLEMQNFKCFKDKKVEFADGQNFVRGANGIGKSTLYSALLWLLFDKSATGDNATDIRPHDSEGNDIHFVDIRVTATFETDGHEITLEKVQKENWVKDRMTREQTFKGNVNSFSVNGIPKSLGDYKAYIAENFCDEETFLSCTNAQSFFRLDTKKRRAKLLTLSGELNDEDVIATNADFEPLRADLRDGTVEELMKRARDTEKRLNEQLKTIPARIDEQAKSKVDIDVAELELDRAQTKRRIAEIEAKEADLSKKYAEYQKASDGILELKSAMSDMQREANEETLAKERQLKDELYEAKATLSGTNADMAACQSEIDSMERTNKDRKTKIEMLSEQWKQAHDRAFDEGSCVCSYCGQEYPQEKKDELRAEFDAHKQDELKRINDAGYSLKNLIAKTDEDIKVANERLELLKADGMKQAAEIGRIQAEIDKPVLMADISTTKDYKALEKQLAEKETFVSKGFDASEARRQMADDKADEQKYLEQINAEIAKAERNTDIDERIAELEQEQSEVAQKIADCQRQLDLLETFNRARMNMLTERVNKHFKRVTWKLFEEQINGGYKDVCYALVGGTNREKGLNDSDGLLADLDILQAFQNMSSVHLPLFLDRAESINPSRIPETDCQLICLTVSEDKEMIVGAR